MPKPNSIRAMTLKGYLDTFYKDRGGYTRWQALTLTQATHKQRAEAFGVNVRTITDWKREEQPHD